MSVLGPNPSVENHPYTKSIKSFRHKQSAKNTYSVHSSASPFLSFNPMDQENAYVSSSKQKESEDHGKGMTCPLQLACTLNQLPHHKTIESNASKLLPLLPLSRFY